MGVLNGRDLFSAKFITAIIITPQNTCYFVPIKRTLGRYWLCELDGKTYAFHLDAGRIITRAAAAVRPVRLLIYFTGHTVPITDVEPLRKFLEVNRLGRVNRTMLVLLRAVGRRQKRDKQNRAKDYPILELTEWVSKQLKDNDPANPALDPEVRQVALELKEYLDNLPDTHIVGDARPISEFLDDDLISTSPGFFGDLFDHMRHVEFEHNIVSNKPLTNKRDWAKMIAVMFGIVGVGLGLFFAYQSGMLDGILSGNFSMPGFSMQQMGPGEVDRWLIEWPDPGELKIAVENGTVDYDVLPPDIQNLIDDLPVATPRG